MTIDRIRIGGHALWWMLACGATTLAQPLPEPGPFLEEVRKNLRSNRILLSQYTFTQARETRYLDKKDQVKRTEQKMWEVFPGVDESRTFRRLVEEDGEPVSPGKLEKQDRRWAKKRSNWKGEDEPKLAEARRKEEEAIEEAFRLFRFQLEAREVVDGYPTVRVSFEPREGYRPRIKEIRPMRKMRGVAWIHEADHQLVRVEIELLRPISFGWVLGKLRKGARLEFARRLVNDEIWLPSESRVKASARILFKGLRLESVDTYSDFQKFSVDTSISFDTPTPP